METRDTEGSSRTRAAARGGDELLPLLLGEMLLGGMLLGRACQKCPLLPPASSQQRSWVPCSGLTASPNAPGKPSCPVQPLGWCRVSKHGICPCLGYEMGTASASTDRSWLQKDLVWCMGALGAAQATFPQPQGDFITSANTAGPLGQGRGWEGRVRASPGSHFHRD